MKKKLKRKMLNLTLQKVRLPMSMSLSQYTAFYSKLQKKYASRSGDLRLVYRDNYYSGGYYLIERRLETKEELAKRQTAVDKTMAQRQAYRERQKAFRAKLRKDAKIRRAKERAAHKKAMMEKRVEEVKALVSILKASGYQVSQKTANSGR